MDTFDEYIINSLYNTHKPTPICVILNKVKCNMCNEEFMSDIEFSFHKLQNVCTKPIKDSDCETIDSDMVPVEEHILDKNLPQCVVCGNFYSHFNFSNHVITHCDLITNQCNICDKTFTTKGSLKSHVMTMHYGNKKHKKHKTIQSCKVTKPSLFKCDRCDRIFKREGFLKNHQRKCLIFKCDICNISFRLQYELKQHKLRKHCEFIFHNTFHDTV